MMSLVVMLLAASPVTLAAPGVTCVGMERSLCEVYLEHFVSVLSANGRVRVTTAKDVAQVLGLERQKQLLGCSSAGSCIVELAGALGVEGLVSASIAKTESGFLVNLRVIRSGDGSAWVQATKAVPSEEALQAYLEGQAEAFEAQLTSGTSGSPGLARWVPAIAGGACVVAGGVLFGWSKADAAALVDRGNALTPDQLASTAARGKVMQPLGIALMGVGAAGVAASLVWAGLAPAAPAQVALVPAPGGAVLSFGGRWP